MRGAKAHLTWVVAVGLLAGLLALTLPSATSAATLGRSSSLPPPDSCAAPIIPCYILLSISSGSHGNHEMVTGARFWPGELFTVYFWNGTAGATAAAVAGGYTGTGGLTANFSIPNDPVGNYTVFVTDLAGDNQSAAFHLTHLVAAPASGAVGNTTSLKGQGFLPDHVVKFRIDGVRASTASVCRTNRTGSFAGCVATVPNVPTGSTRLTATDGTYVARIGFVVG